MQNEKLKKGSERMQRDITERTFRFALMVIELAKLLPHSGEAPIVSKQVIRSGMSVGANVEEAEAASTRNDFAHRMGIALREARETHYWLRILHHSQASLSAQIAPVLQEADELKKILGAIVSSTKGTRKPR